MKRSTLSSAIIITTALFSTTTFAALSLKGEVIPEHAAVYNWTGFYAGLNAGLVNHTMDITDNQATTFYGTLQQTTNPKFTGGFQLGYRQQLDLASASGVYGLEFSANFSDAKFNKEYGSPFALYQINSEHELKTVCLLQLTGGIAADRTLLFLAAGAGWVKIDGTITNLDSIVFFDSFHTAKDVWGTALGGGIEYAFTNNLSARVKLDVITPNTYSVSNDTGGHYQVANRIVEGTIGVNYKFA